MPQMAPLLWLYLFLFFLTSLALMLILNIFIKPFEAVTPPIYSTPTTQKLWKL